MSSVNVNRRRFLHRVGLAGASLPLLGLIVGKATAAASSPTPTPLGQLLDPTDWASGAQVHSSRNSHRPACSIRQRLVTYH
ncbi:hypothetical protein [Nitrincola alkalisediminis]|uniref:hypothetical protein n=1 Tax=Nitrincola alkalisediminis TaxID=1366656 RepID=UPI0018739764|nr:hypothetical protein [Nitrincola alkalisediminis]